MGAKRLIGTDVTLPTSPRGTTNVSPLTPRTPFTSSAFCALVASTVGVIVTDVSAPATPMKYSVTSGSNSGSKQPGLMIRSESCAGPKTVMVNSYVFCLVLSRKTTLIVFVPVVSTITELVRSLSTSTKLTRTAEPGYWVASEVTCTETLSVPYGRLNAYSKTSGSKEPAGNPGKTRMSSSRIGPTAFVPSISKLVRGLNTKPISP
mmetsp:Transcript_516/g.1814  ORF Transcript_516/g.1814 Transcript_516/m.1814 type:complete len:206 (-) Transcript_516:5354-5971(-)